MDRNDLSAGVSFVILALLACACASTQDRPQVSVNSEGLVTIRVSNTPIDEMVELVNKAFLAQRVPPLFRIYLEHKDRWDFWGEPSMDGFDWKTMSYTSGACRSECRVPLITMNKHRVPPKEIIDDLLAVHSDTVMGAYDDRAAVLEPRLGGPCALGIVSLSVLTGSVIVLDGQGIWEQAESCSRVLGRWQMVKPATGSPVELVFAAQGRETLLHVESQATNAVSIPNGLSVRMLACSPTSGVVVARNPWASVAIEGEPLDVGELSRVGGDKVQIGIVGYMLCGDVLEIVGFSKREAHLMQPAGSVTGWDPSEAECGPATIAAADIAEIARYLRSPSRWALSYRFTATSPESGTGPARHGVADRGRMR